MSSEAFAFGTVARLVPFKGHLHLLEAAAQLAPRYREARWILIGDGPEREALVRRAGELGITERVRFLGSRDDVLRLLQGLDCFVLPSLAEGMPNALLEGMATGLPAIGTAVSGTEEILEPGRSGWLVEPASAAALAAAMGEALADPAKAAELGRGARRRIESDFDLPVAVDRYLALFELAVARRATA
jgi:glycosyltransferase involved in cell wall biosynthesis